MDQREIRLGCLQAAVAGSHERLGLDEIMLRALELERFVNEMEPDQAIRERIFNRQLAMLASHNDMVRALQQDSKHPARKAGEI